MERADLDLLAGTALFAGFSLEELQGFVGAFPPLQRAYTKGETILAAGEENSRLAIVLAGEVEAVKETRVGRTFVVARQRRGALVGDVLSGGHSKSPVTLRSVGASRLLFFSYPQMLAAPPRYSALLRHFFANWVAVLSGKYFALHHRVDLLLLRSLRQKIAAYLLHEAGTGNEVTLRFTREGWANYLGCERSALSRELSRMAAEGLIALSGRRVTLLQPDMLQASLQ